MDIAALSIGCLAPRPPSTGRLVAAHPRALAVLHEDGALLSLLEEGAPMEARAIALGGADFSLLREACGRALTGGAPAVRLEAGSVELAGFRIGTDGAEPWDPRPRAASIGAAWARLGPRRRRARLATLARLYRARRPDFGIHAPGAFAEAFSRLRSRPDFPACLVGFGPGTTPAGDDYLSGRSLAAAMTGGAAPLSGGAALERTSPAGRSLLLAAAEGAFHEGLLGLGEALAAPPSRVGRDALGDLVMTAESLLGHGASSGADALLGLLEGLEGAEGGAGAPRGAASSDSGASAESGAPDGRGAPRPRAVPDHAYLST